MNLKPTTLYIKDNKGAIRRWSIGVEDGLIIIEHGHVNGKLQVVTEEVYEGKSNRTLEEQISLRVASRISKRKDMGYVENIEDVQDKPKNLLGLKKPMLALPIKNIKEIDFSNAYVQHKYDGNRCLIANVEGEKIAYTRNGKRYTVLDHIIDSIDIPINTILDGELYCHGETLQSIVSWCKRDTPLPETKKLKYHCYDIISNEPFYKRMDKLMMIDYGESAEFVETHKVHNMDDTMAFFINSRCAGYEGGILRWGNLGYEEGKRSKSLIKIKQWLDDEFLVVAINPSKDYWGILTCQLINGNLFSVSAPGNMEEKREVLINKQDYIGRKIRVEYAYITKDGIPFHPVATNWIK